MFDNLIELLEKNAGEGNTPIRQAVTMLRQQQARIHILERDYAFMKDLAIWRRKDKTDLLREHKALKEKIAYLEAQVYGGPTK